jgi:putative transposase
MEAVDTLSPDVGIRAACEAFGLSRATRYRYKTAQSFSSSDVLARPAPPRALSPDERQAVLDTLHCDRFIDLAPHEVYATLLDEGKYYCSIRTMYRILEDNREVKERRNQLRHPAYSKPELLATAPNQVWSWDITKLLGPVKWSYFYLYVILDIFSRYVVGWMVADRESAPLAKRLIYETCCKQSIEPGELTLHADRGSSMKSKPVALLLSDLGVTKTHSRPHTSDDNPFSESQFKTLKYRPAFPKRFGSIEDARAFSQGFFSWYNKEHHHTGIALLTPEIVHHGKAPDVLRERQNILFAAFKDHPERFVRKTPEPQILHEAVWINPPKDGLYTVAREGEAWSKASSKEAANQAAAERSPPHRGA